MKIFKSIPLIFLLSLASCEAKTVKYDVKIPDAFRAAFRFNSDGYEGDVTIRKDIVDVDEYKSCSIILFVYDITKDRKTFLKEDYLSIRKPGEEKYTNYIVDQNDHDNWQIKEEIFGFDEMYNTAIFCKDKEFKVSYIQESESSLNIEYNKDGNKYRTQLTNDEYHVCLVPECKFNEETNKWILNNWYLYFHVQNVGYSKEMENHPINYFHFPNNNNN